MRATTLAIVLPLAGIGAAHAAEHIFSDDFDPARFNDTGITFCGGYPSGNAACEPTSIQGQDAQYGRDALAASGQLVKVGGGDAGFDFTKIANDGSELPPSAVLGDGSHDWACTRDNVTGLVWEVKVPDLGNPRYMGYTYTWFDPESPDGDPGESGSPATCGGSLGLFTNCNTTTYVQKVDQMQTCGAMNWRIPTLAELLGVADFGRLSPAIDMTYFPNTVSQGVYWSNNQVACVSCSWAWALRAESGEWDNPERNQAHQVRVVHGRP